MLQTMDFSDYQGATLSRDTVQSLLQGCVQKKDLVAARQVYSLMKRSGLSLMAFWGGHLIRLFASCGSLPEANQAFHEVSNPNVFNWNAIISAHAQLGEPERALDLYEIMQQQRIEPDKVTFLCSLKACGKTGAIEQGRMIHHHIAKNGLESDVVVGTALINMYAKCKGLKEACKVFNELSEQNCVSWSSMISAYTQLGCSLSALDLFTKMQQEEIGPSRVTFLCVLKACARIRAIEEGRLIHNMIIRNGLEVDVNIGSLLVDLYSKCENLADAHRVFDKLHSQDMVSWTALIGGYTKHGHGVLALQLFEKSQQAGVTPNRVTFLSVLKACSSKGAILLGRLIHDQMCRNGMEVDVTVGSTLLDMYAKYGSLSEARKTFDNLPSRNVVSWDAMISGYAQYGHNLCALEMFDKMQQEGVKPIKVTFLSILKACNSLQALVHGRMIHDQIVRTDLSSDVATGNSLVDMYSKCGSLEEAHRVFSTLTTRTVVSWSAMVDGFVQHRQQLSAFEYYMRMQEEGIVPDEATFSSILRACRTIGSVEQGKLLHDQIIKSELEAGVVVGSAIVDMYAKCGNLPEAQKVFNKLSNRNVVSWGAMISGYAHYGHAHLAIHFFQKMQQEGTQPDKATFVCTLKACARIGNIKVGMSLHNQLILNNFDSDALLGTALIDMYARSACLEEARRVFDGLSNRDVVSWAALIAGYTHCRESNMANDCLKEMQQQGFRPVDVIYTSVISGCSHAGQLTEGHYHFQCMTNDYGIKPSIEQYSCMVDLLGRAGSLNEANDVLHTMPTMPDLMAWTSLLTGCRTYGNVDLGQQCFDEIFQTDLTVTTDYLPMAKHHVKTQIQGAVSKTGSDWVETGSDWVETSNKSHELIAGGKGPQQSVEVYSNMSMPSEPLKKEGYVPQIDAVLEQIVDEDQAPLLCRNCERLALALGLVNSYKHETTYSSSHVCIACHNSLKAISRVERRETTVRDPYRIHRFRYDFQSRKGNRLSGVG